MEDRLKGEGSEEYLRKIELKINKIKQLMKENKPVEFVQCKNCGLTFDYNGVKEWNLEDYIKNTMRYMIRYVAEDEVAKFVNEMKPEIQAIIARVLVHPDIEMKELKQQPSETEIKEFQIKAKSVIEANIMSYVNCPNCYEVVYKSLAPKEPQESTPTDDEPSKEWYLQIDWKL
jgi:hypothetical protein